MNLPYRNTLKSHKLAGNANFVRWLPHLASVGVLVLITGLFVVGAQAVAVGLIPEPWDKLAHAGAFGMLTLLLILSLKGQVWWATGLAIAIGGLDEFHQGALPGRVMGLDDLAADVVGAVLAAFLVKWISRQNYCLCIR